MNESPWGPPYEQYSQRDFQPRFLDISSTDSDAFYKERRVPSLVSIEHAICRINPKIGRSASLDMGEILEVIDNYLLAIHDTKIFRYYYGFVCARYLLYIVTMSFLDPRAFEAISASLDQSATWEDGFKAVNYKALDYFVEATKSSSSFEKFCLDMPIGPCYYKNSKMKEAYGSKIISLLWSNRDSFLILASRGLLPGCPLIFFDASMFLGHKGNRSNRVGQDASWLRDISTRLYLVGSHQDRQVLQIVDRLAWKQYESLRSSASSDSNPFVSAEDSHAMARGYSGLLLVLKNHLPGTENITLERLLSLTNFTLAITGYNPSATALEKLDIANTALQFLWFMLELKDRIRWEDHNFARTIGYMVFAQLRLVQTQHTLSPNEQHKFAEVLAYNDVIGLAGRILLLICTDEGNDYQNTLGMEDYLGSLTSLGKFLERPVRQAPELFTDSKVQWSKVNSYCVALRDAETSRRNPRSHVLRVLKYMTDAWNAYEPIRTGKRTPRSCAYPRCARGIIYENESGVQYTCGRCNLATYCDSNCQNAHWKLPTSTCHKVICIR